MAASGKTFLQIVNRVLVRLRESTVASHDSTDYSTLIGAMVNAVKSEIEDAWQWHSMRETFSVSAVNGTTSYAFTGAGKNATILDAWNTTSGQRLARGTNADFNAHFFGTDLVHEGFVSEYLPAGVNGNYDLSIDVWPNPSSAQTLKFNLYVPQGELDENTDVPLVPEDVLIEEVIARLLLEKGEEGAAQPDPGERFIRKDLLTSAIARDGGHDDSEFDWQVE